jgi:RNA polymerase sigma-70 factor (ECF subfamily)
MWLLHLERRRRGGIAAVPAASEDSASPAELAASSDPDPLRLMLDQEKVEVVRAAIEELPERVQDCLRARLVDDLSYREIGKRLGITESTVAVHVHRGIKNLRARLKAFAGPVLAARGLLDGSK